MLWTAGRTSHTKRIVNICLVHSARAVVLPHFATLDIRVDGTPPLLSWMSCFDKSSLSCREYKQQLPAYNQILQILTHSHSFAKLFTLFLRFSFLTSHSFVTIQWPESLLDPHLLLVCYPPMQCLLPSASRTTLPSRPEYYENFLAIRSMMLLKEANDACKSARPHPLRRTHTNRRSAIPPHRVSYHVTILEGYTSDPRSILTPIDCYGNVVGSAMPM